MNQWQLKLVVSGVCISAVLFRIYLPDVKMDGINCSLLVLSLLPWLSPLIKSCELPGGWKIEFQDVSKAGDKIIQASASAHISAEMTPVPMTNVHQLDPNLALVSLRIEIEKRVRALAQSYELPANRSLAQMLSALANMEAVPSNVAAGLRDLVAAGNSAAHGARVDQSVASWAIAQGPEILGVLDGLLDGKSA